MKKILIAVDVARSEGNDLILQTGKDIAAASDGELYLMYAIDPIPGRVYPEIPEELVGKHKAFAEEKMQELLAQSGSTNGAVIEGPPSTKILDHAAEIGADLIVLHSHDPDISNYFLGSVASRVVRHAHCSVHIVREAK